MMSSNESKSPVTLHIDIFSHIIRFLAFPEDFCYPDKESIRVLSLTCQDLVPLCQRQIFRSITIKHNRSGGSSGWSELLTVDGLHGLLEVKPVIADYVRILLYNVHTSDFGDEMVLRVLRSLRSLEGVVLSFSYAPPGFDPPEPQEWGMIPEDLQKALLEMIGQSNLRSLTMTGIKIAPPTILYSVSPAIRFLYIQEVRLAPLSNPFAVAHAPPKPIPLVSLSCAASQWNILHQLHMGRTPLFDFSGVRALIVHVCHDGSQDAGNQILRPFQNVENLSIIHTQTVVSPSPNISLKEFMDGVDTTALQNIKSIRIVCAVGLIDGPFLPFQSLQRFRTFKALQKLCLSMVVAHALLEAPSAFCEDLARLDEHLTSPEFPALRNLKVEINIIMSPNRGRDGAAGGDLLSSKEQCFPLLVKSETVWLEYIVFRY